MSFGNRLKSALKHRKITQKEFAQKMEVRPQSINQYINERRQPSRNNVSKMALVLHLGYSYTKSGEAYFYDFVDSESNPKYEENNKFNHEQYTDAVKDVIEDISEINFFGDSVEEINFKLNPNKPLKSPRENAISQLDKLNDDGKRKAYDLLELLTRIPDYQNGIPDQDNDSSGQTEPQDTKPTK